MGLVRTSLIHGGPTSPSEGFWGSNSRGLVSTQTHAAVSVCFIVSITHLDRDIIKCWSTSETLHQTGCSSDLNLSRCSHLFTWSCVSSTCYQQQHISLQWKCCWITLKEARVHRVLAGKETSLQPEVPSSSYMMCWPHTDPVWGGSPSTSRCHSGWLQAVASRTRNRILVHKKACSNPPRMRQTAQILKG